MICRRVPSCAPGLAFGPRSAPASRRLSCSAWKPRNRREVGDKSEKSSRTSTTMATLLLPPIAAPTRIEDVGGCEIVGQHLPLEFLRQRHALFGDQFRHVETE